MVTLYECSGCGYFEAWECPRCDKVCVGCGEVVRDPHWGSTKIMQIKHDYLAQY